MTVTAPYNFVRIPRAVWYPEWGELISHEIPFEDGFCGYLDLQITTKTPLLVGGPRKGAKKSPPASGEVWPVWQKRENNWQYVIPNASLQGMLRNVLTIASFGKLGPNVEKKRFGFREMKGKTAQEVFSKRLSEISGHPPRYDHDPMQKIEPRVKGGWLRRAGNKFYFTPCEIARIEFTQLQKIYGADKNFTPNGKNYSIKTIEGRYRLVRADETPKNLTKNLWVEDVADNPRHRHGRTNDTRSDKPLSIAYCMASKDSTFVSSSLIGTANKTLKDGKIVFTGHTGAPGKHMEFFFHSEGNEIELNEFEHKFREFVEIHDPEDGRPKNTSWQYYRDKGYPGNKSFQSGGKMPIFYIEEKKTILSAEPLIDSFGLAFMFKLAHQFDTHQMLAHSSAEHVSKFDGNEASDTGKLDLASLIFGAIGGKKDDFFNKSLKRRASFEDAVWTPENKNTNALISSDNTILLGPKPSFYPSYIRQASHQNNQLPQNWIYATFTPTPNCTSPELSGTKAWPVSHDNALVKQNGKVNVPSPPAGVSLSVQTKLNAIPIGKVFNTRLHFHNLRGVELGALIWALSFGSEKWCNRDEPEFRHRLGMAKPYGLGSVAIKLAESQIIPNEVFYSENEKKELAPETHLAEFQKLMEATYKLLEGGNSNKNWSESPQIKGLRKAATRDDVYKNYMRLTDHTVAKSQRYFLKPLIDDTNNELTKLSSECSNDSFIEQANRYGILSDNANHRANGERGRPTSPNRAAPAYNTNQNASANQGNLRDTPPSGLENPAFAIGDKVKAGKAGVGKIVGFPKESWDMKWLVEINGVTQEFGEKRIQKL